MNFKQKVFSIVLFLSYIFLLVVIFVYNNPLEKDFQELASTLQDKKIATLVDDKGHFIVANEDKFEAWIDLDFMKRRNKYYQYKFLLNQRFNDDELKDKKFLKWGSYETYAQAYLDLGVLNKFSRIYPINVRVYNEIFSLPQVIGKLDKTMYGIEPFLYENKLLETSDTVKLSIDLKMQQIAYEEVLNAVKKEEAEGGIAIIMETNTGKIKASASIYPWNIGYMGYIEPGSTLKPILMAIAIDQNIININDKFYSGLEYVPLSNIDFVVTESQGYGFGEIGLKETLVYSSNIVISKIMTKILQEYSNLWLYEQLLNFGFGNKTGIEFKGEINGVFPHPSEWYAITPYQISLGQGIGITPIQLITAFNVIPNKGKYVKPSFLNDSIPKERLVISEPTAEMVKDWLGYTVLKGTAKRAYKEGLKIGGKTGTAQKAQGGVGYIEGNYYSLFVGFYPVVNPKYTALVIIDNPKNEFYGGEIAAPVVTNVFYRYFKPSENNYTDNGKLYFKDIMPNLVGYTPKEAYNILLNLGIDENAIIITGNGDKVVSQSIEPYSYIDDFKIIQLHTLK
ncbi:MAG: penicillin-binding transpeptidase domain-containing protein [Defluviitoga tunisiensis]|jgi:cell division protein FtsI (penicillin-binding protein 3)|uniref:Cell division protein FtsI/penicillin-binding protein 2 n=1 Tax=Defluviitoga tunisiensis TaxID=1006576 RepID=A0A0C7NXV0_DEFTU|nr:penicillin-binding transpeptidase domain-containing protein [Defluviitoga tunisiensis]CEP78138.1 Cell division protein FtsI/penicillin-binding protein 2 [Defluviitoga tunisiensis]